MRLLNLTRHSIFDRVPSRTSGAVEVLSGKVFPETPSVARLRIYYLKFSVIIQVYQLSNLLRLLNSTCHSIFDRVPSRTSGAVEVLSGKVFPETPSVARLRIYYLKFSVIIQVYQLSNLLRLLNSTCHSIFDRVSSRTSGAIEVLSGKVFPETPSVATLRIYSRNRKEPFSVSKYARSSVMPSTIPLRRTLLLSVMKI